MKRAAITITALFLATPLAPSDLQETKTTLRANVLKLINRDRQLYNLPPVQLDLPASALADTFCREQIRTGTTGHYGTNGFSPYMRYSFGGGNDGVSENAAAWSANYTFTQRALYEMSRRSQDAMMAEMPPGDGHKRTILDPHANYVGIGLAWEKGEFRLAHEFIRRYVNWTRVLPRHAKADQQVLAAGRPLHGTRIEAITVHHEAAPEAMSALVANAIHKYSLPDKRKEYVPRLPRQVRRRPDGSIEILSQEYTDGRRGDFHLAEDGSFSFPIPFTEGAGVYTVVVWVRKPGDANPIAASNVSIRVEGALPTSSRAERGSWAGSAASTAPPAQVPR